MSILEKIKRSWWVILSFIMFLNGFGFIYIGLKHNNKNWVLEGITYEIPWFFYFIVFATCGNPSIAVTAIISFALILLLVSIIRSIWVAVKLADVYDNTQKYTIQQTALNSHKQVQTDDNNSSKMGCCLCIICLFILFAIISIF